MVDAEVASSMVGISPFFFSSMVVFPLFSSMVVFPLLSSMVVFLALWWVFLQFLKLYGGPFAIFLKLFGVSFSIFSTSMVGLSPNEGRVHKSNSVFLNPSSS